MQEKNKYSENFTENLLDNTNPVRAIREKLYSAINSKKYTIKSLADKSGLPEGTLRTLMYGNANDCKLSTAVALAKTLEISIDELIGADTLDVETYNSMRMCRGLPQNVIGLIRWFIRHQHTLHRQDSKDKKIISVMEPICTNDGVMKVANRFKQIDISGAPEDIQSKVFFGFHIPNSNYMPLYSSCDVLLIANDRKPINKEHVLILVKNSIYIAKQRYENGKYKYYGIFDNKFRTDQNGVDEVIGYITWVVPDTSEDGER